MSMDQLKNSPSGQLVPTVRGQSAFVPSPLPRDIQPSMPLMHSLDEASSAVATWREWVRLYQTRIC